MAEVLDPIPWSDFSTWLTNHGVSSPNIISVEITTVSNWRGTLPGQVAANAVAVMVVQVYATDGSGAPFVLGMGTPAVETFVIPITSTPT